jgi:hypothetical protein
MGGVVVLPLRVSRKLSTSVDCEREANFGAHASTPLRWIAHVSRLLTDPTTSVAKSPGTSPKRSAASLTASAVFDNAKHARPHHLGDAVSQFEAKPFARHPALGRGDNWFADLGPLTSCE